MKISVRIDKARMDWGDLMDLESPNQTTIARIMAKHMLDESGEYLKPEAAMKVLRSVPLDEIGAALEQFQAAFKDYKEQATPPTGGGR